MLVKPGRILRIGLVGCLWLGALTACTAQPEIDRGEQITSGLALPLTNSQPQPTGQINNTPRPTHPPATILTPRVEADKFYISASNFRFDEDQVKVDVCFNLPDSQDWMTDRAWLQLGGLTLDQSGGELLDYQEADSQGKPGRRCDTFFFETLFNPDIAEAVLTIESVSAPTREGQYCAFLLNTVQPALDQQDTGIKLACTEQTGYSAAKVISKPQGMSQAEAEQIAFSPQYYRVDGPWQFTALDIPTATPFPTVAVNDPNADPDALLRTLNQMADASLVYPDWLYLQENWQHDIDPDHWPGEVDGGYMPKSYQRETWLRLDENRRVVQSVSLLKDLSGNILDSEVFSGGMVWSPSSGESYVQTPYRFHLNEPFIGALQANLEGGNGETGRSELDDRPVISFSVDEKINTEDPNFYAQPIRSNQVSAYLDPASGQLRMLKTIATLADGSQRMVEWMQLLIIRLTEPPPHVLDTLQKMNQP